MQDHCGAVRSDAGLLLFARLELELPVDVVLDAAVAAVAVVRVAGHSDILVVCEQFVEAGEAFGCCVENLLEGILADCFEQLLLVLDAKEVLAEVEELRMSVIVALFWDAAVAVELLSDPFFQELDDLLVVLLILLVLPGEIFLQLVQIRVQFGDLLIPFGQICVVGEDGVIAVVWVRGGLGGLGPVEQDVVVARVVLQADVVLLAAVIFLTQLATGSVEELAEGVIGQFVVCAHTLDCADPDPHLDIECEADEPVDELVRVVGAVYHLTQNM